MSLLLGNTLKNLEVKGHHTYNLFSNNLEKNVHICLSVCVCVCVYKEKEKERIKQDLENLGDKYREFIFLQLF